MRQERVIDRAPDDSRFSRLPHRREILLLVEGHQRQSLTDVFEKKQDLLSA
jgi:hypothetical protein